MATSQKHSFWYVNLRRLPAEFYINFDEQLIPERKPTDEPPEPPAKRARDEPPADEA
jgi:hypothetical protein